uniref:Reverse transcriptase Ty1/copia-type domain-containing protein n=1 Tax=Trichuris muris TaxID=70415 RepID=A0A5S6QYJ2_TRIMR
MEFPDAGIVSAPAEEADNDADQNAEEVRLVWKFVICGTAQLRQPVRFDDYVLMAANAENPISYADAMQTAELVAGTNSEVVYEFVKLLQQEFKIIGSLDCFLGIHIQRQTDGSVFVGQSGYCKRILKKFSMAGENKVSTPCVKAAEVEDALDESVQYRSAVGSLMYLAAAKRPDIAFAVSTVSQKLDSPTKADWEVVKRIFRYLRGTTGVGILYLPKANAGCLEAYRDADFAGYQNTRKSTSGVVCKYSGGIITWLSNKQRITSSFVDL